MGFGQNEKDILNKEGEILRKRWGDKEEYAET